MTFDLSAINAAAELISDADALLVCAGAGMGVDSGLPDFRGTEGFWGAYPALGRRGLEFYEVANPQTFEAYPALAWGLYGHWLGLYRSTRPHAGFDILRRWGEQKCQGYGVFTSNVDGHFQRAGFDSAWVTECHGSIHHLQCSKPCSETTWPADDFVPETDDAACKLLNAPPTCPRCGAVARPNSLMFGDGSWSELRARAQETHLRRWREGAGRVVVIELGAGTAIPPGAALQACRLDRPRRRPGTHQPARARSAAYPGCLARRLRARSPAGHRRCTVRPVGAANHIGNCFANSILPGADTNARHRAGTESCPKLGRSERHQHIADTDPGVS